MRNATAQGLYLDRVNRYAIITAAAATSIALLLSGCGAEESPADTSAGTATSSSNAPAASSSAPAPETAPVEQDATAVAEQNKQTTTTKVVTITEDNDPNNLIGRPNGYVSAAVLYDSNATCTELGVSCGATVEVWSDAAAAKARSEYIQAILKDAPVLGSELHTLNGAVLLRVDGKQLKPSQAKAYADALSTSRSGLLSTASV